MSASQQILLGNAPAAAGGYQISRSLRFNSADSAYLNRTPASAGNRKTWTWSGWVKRSKISDTNIQTLLSTASNVDLIGFNADDTLRVWTNTNNNNIATTQVFRDVSAWYHIVVAMDTTQATASNRLKIYLNGSQITAVSGTYPTQNYDTSVNNTVQHRIGYTVSGDYNYFSGYLTEINFIDGQALDPTSFGEYNVNTGVWQPKAYTGSYGTNGFYLDFSDNSGTTSTTLGKDYSGNGNNWTPNNFSVTAGAGNDSLVDTPTPYGTDTGAGGEVRGNYCTLNTISAPSAYVLSDGNLNFSATASDTSSKYLKGTVGVSSGKWYWEVTPSNIGGGPNLTIGIQNASYSSNTGTLNTIQSGYGYYAFGQKEDSSGQTSYGASYAANDVIGVAFDADSGTITFYKNNTSQGTAFSSIPAGTYIPVISFGTGGVSRSIAGASNFGQRPFAYTAPSGFKALCTQNLPEPTIVDGGNYFNPVLYTGNNSNGKAVTGVGFSPDLIWFKSRSAANGHCLVNRITGVNAGLGSDSTAAEQNPNLASFDADGFTVNSVVDFSSTNANGNSIVAWNWKANGAGSTNTAGTITSTVSVNTTSGFSIVTYTGNGSANATVGHGLGVSPSMVIVKKRTGGSQSGWVVHHSSFANSASDYLSLQTTDGIATASNWFSKSSTTFGFPTVYDGTNTNTSTYVAYCFAAIPGYSAFSSYTGNGSTDGPFVFTNHRPRFLLVKCSSAAGEDWIIVDAVRNEYNYVNKFLYPNLSNAEGSAASNNVVDFLSNGFKVRSTSGAWNSSSTTYVYASFCENPFKYSLAR